MPLGEWMKEVRRVHRLTAEECAVRAGVKQPVWAEWESDQGQRRRSTVEKIAIGLGVGREEALVAAGFRPEEEPEPERELKLLFAGLTADQQRVILNAARAMRDTFIGIAA